MRNPEPKDPSEEEKEAAMFKKASKHISRSGTTPVKVLFSIEVKTVALKSISDLVDGRYPAQPLFHRPFYHFSFYLYLTDILSFFLYSPLPIRFIGVLSPVLSMFVSSVLES